MHVDHILPDGGDHPDNLALACPLCNLSKSSFTEGIDPETGEVFPLFNPCIELWRDHFTWIDAGCRIRGMTPTGRVTVERLRLNRDQVVVARSLWVKAGLHPPFIPGLAE